MHWAGDRLDRSRIFLIAVAAVFIPIIALPLFIDPVWWADRFGWETDGAGELTDYLGRCLGAVALAISLIALRAARDPAGNTWLFDLLALSAGLLAVVHLRGAIEDSQPVIEHLETAIYAVFALAAWLYRPAPSSG